VNLFHVKRSPNDPYEQLHAHLTHLETLLMATVADLTQAVQANAQATTDLTAAITAHVTAAIDPAALDAPLQALGQNTAALVAATQALAPVPAAPAA